MVFSIISFLEHKMSDICLFKKYHLFYIKKTNADNFRLLS